MAEIGNLIAKLAQLLLRRRAGEEFVVATAPDRLLAELSVLPDNITCWQKLLGYCRTTKARLVIPDDLLGSPYDLIDAELCFVKAEYLLAQGQEQRAAAFLRFVSNLAKSRDAAVGWTFQASVLDNQFQELVRRADRSRDLGEWALGEADYWSALSLYPLHYGYMAQYAHTLKEQGRFSEAEIYYRSALALGGPPDDLIEHIQFVASKDGYDAPIEDARHGPVGIGMDAMPTHLDIRNILFLCFGECSHCHPDILPTMRACSTVKEVFTRIVNASRFATVNQQLLYAIGDGRHRPKVRPAPEPPPIVAPPFAKSVITTSMPHLLSIVLVSHAYPPEIDAGIARWTYTVANGLAQRGHRVRVVTRTTTQQDSICQQDGVHVHTVRSDAAAAKSVVEQFNIPSGIAEWAARSYREVEVIKSAQGDVDIVSFPIFDLECLPCQHDEEVTTVVSLHTTYALSRPFKPEWRARPILDRLGIDPIVTAERDCLVRAATILANSDAVISDIEAAYAIAIRERCVIVPHGTDDLLSNVETFCKNEPFHVLYVGRHEERKGFDLALLASKLISKSLPDARITFVGGVNDESVKGLAARLACADVLDNPRILFRGIVPRPELEELYRRCSVVMIPSRYESFGLVAIEAMSAATPVIAVGVGGLAEVVQHGFNGLLVDLDDDTAQHIADAVVELALDPGRLDTLGRGARKTFLEKYTIDAMITQIESAYRFALTSQRTRHA